MEQGAAAHGTARKETSGPLHVDLVYAAALRQLHGDLHAAADVTQAVFLVAARKAKSGRLPPEERMAGWLLKVTRYAVKESRRAAIRRKFHEKQMAENRGPAALADSGAEAEEAKAVVDEMLLKLRTLDREVVIRRYLEGKTVREVGESVGLAEKSAGRRIGRALEKLRKILVRRGVGVPAVGLAGLMLAESAKAAPVGLAVGAGTSPSACAATIAKGATMMMKMTMLKMVATVTVAALAACVGVVLAADALQPATPVPHLATLPAANPGEELQFYVNGAVARPGVYAMHAKSPITLRQAVAAARLVPAPASQQITVLVTRSQGGNEEQQFKANLNAILNGTETDYILQPNDFLTVTTAPVDAAALVREVREKEKWIETVKSFHVTATVTYPLSKELVANFHQLVLEQAAKNLPPERRLAKEVGPPGTGALELAFDGRRAFSHRLQPELDETRVWDGARGVEHIVIGEIAGADSHKSEQYEIPENATFLATIMWDFAWPMADPHPMWWAAQANKEPELNAQGGVFGPIPGGEAAEPKTKPKPEDFVYLRTEKFHDIDCYVLGRQGTETERWSIGVKDHLLHRVEKGQLPDPDMWKKYLPEAQKRGAAITDDRTLYTWLQSLPEKDRAQISGPIEHAYQASGNARTEFWLLDYVEIKPGQWYPKLQGTAYYQTRRYDGKQWVDDYAHPFANAEIDIKVTDLQVDGALPDSMFTMEIKKGVLVTDLGGRETGDASPR